MNLKLKLLAPLAILTLLSGCATTGGTSMNPFSPKPVATNPDGTAKTPEGTRKQAGTRGFLRGCGVGALMGALSRNAQAIVAGCAFAGVAETRTSLAQYDAQVAAARSFQKATVSVGVITQVKTASVAVPTKQADGSTQTQTTERLDKLTVPLKADRVVKQDPAIADVLKKAGALAANDKTGAAMAVLLRCPDGECVWMRNQVALGVAGAGNVALATTKAPDYALEISPIPTTSK